MKIRELDAYIRTLLTIDEMTGTDNSMNGLQVGRFDKEVTRVAFAVDACLESITRAAEGGAEMLFVHHGLFWGREQPLVGPFYQRIAALIEHDLALYAAHLPLDMHPQYGNNAGLALRLGLVDLLPFGAYKKVKIGYKGRLPEALTLDQLLGRLGMQRDELPGFLSFGPDEISTVAVISGGADKEVEQAIAEGVDLYLTGEISHQVYHQCQEAGINLIAAGHYRTETVGVNLLADKIAEDKGLETFFIDLPTGL
jgi:dinuclear metal center YbgI/SA1388 family protein